MEELFLKIKQDLQGQKCKRILFPEHTDERVIRAAVRLAEERLVIPVFIAEEAELKEVFRRYRLPLHGIEYFHPSNFNEVNLLAEAIVKRRRNEVGIADVLEKFNDPTYFATSLVYAGYADGLVSGAMQTTSYAVLPALQIIKPKKGVKKVSGAYIMLRNDEKYIFADCAINISPTSEELAEITLQSVETANLLQLDPKVALLSFSTKGSAQAKEVDKVKAALEQVKHADPTLVIDGEMQFDAAYVPQLAAKKAPDRSFDGQANVFVFPNLEAGNISCKIAERLGGFQAIGPIMQGLNKPVNLLSRGCSEDDVYKVALFTARQALYEK